MYVKVFQRGTITMRSALAKIVYNVQVCVEF